MKFKSLVLGSVAIVGLATASPALAYTHHPSTAAERKQTDDLNAQALAKAQSDVQPAAMQTAQTQSMPVEGAQQTADTSTTAQRTADSMAQTEGAPAQGAQQTASNASTEGSSLATAAASGTVALSAISNPPQTLANASVETQSGQAVGAVQKVVTDGNGKAQTVNVALLGAQSKIVALDASKLSFDQSRNVVVAQLSVDQIQAMPAAPQS